MSELVDRVRRLRLDKPPRKRVCSAFPDDEKFCGKQATHVARDDSGLEWFCCGAEKCAGTAKLTPIDDWFAAAEELWKAREAITLLQEGEADGNG